MKENELRIGNIINYNGDNFKVNLEFFSELDSGIIKIEDFEPIPFSDKWFKTFDIEWYDYKESILINGYRISITDIKTVHNFQNIYFSLKGEDL